MDGARRKSLQLCECKGCGGGGGSRGVTTFVGSSTTFIVCRCFECGGRNDAVVCKQARGDGDQECGGGEELHDVLRVCACGSF